MTPLPSPALRRLLARQALRLEALAARLDARGLAAKTDSYREQCARAARAFRVAARALQLA